MRTNHETPNETRSQALSTHRNATRGTVRTLAAAGIDIANAMAKLRKIDEFAEAARLIERLSAICESIDDLGYGIEMALDARDAQRRTR